MLHAHTGRLGVIPDTLPEASMAPLLVSSHYSFHFGTASPGDLARRARSLGYTSLGLADRNGVYGVPAFIEACEAEGLLPIIGTELVYGQAGGTEGGRALLVAREASGFSRICELLSARAEPGFDARAELLADACGLTVASDDPLLLSGDGADDFCALLSPQNIPLWRGLLGSGRRPLAVGEARFLEPGDQELQRLLVAIGSGRTVADVGSDELSKPASILCGPAELEALYGSVPAAIAENKTLAAEITFRSLFSGFIFPRYDARGKEESARTLRRLVKEGIATRYSDALAKDPGLADRLTTRMDYELGIIEEKGFSDYFLVVRDIVRKASRTCGRGSAAASIVSYSLGITDVDPVRHGLYFERFLNPGREDPPDIDVDFAWDERDALLESVIAEYGPARASRVSNHVCFQTRSALRETARAYGMPDGEISAYERRADMDQRVGLDDADWQAIARLAPRLTGIPRHLGVHSGGLILVPDRLSSRVPLEHSGSGIRVTAWDKDGVEAAGLVKIDLLGNRSLAVVRDALANAHDNGQGIDEAAWNPIDDPATVELLARGDTMGVFYVESPAMRLLQKKTGRGDFEHLVIHSSIIRPAANRYIDEYIDRLKGKPYRPLHPLIGDILSESYGIMCYQEDVCKVAVALAGFSASEADKVRKVLSRRDAAERLVSYRQKFFKGAMAKGVDEATIEDVWRMVESFSGYSFVKAHSASYAMLSFRSAYLRCHHPAEFMAAVISNRGGYYSTLAYASEARRMGLSLLPPDVDESVLRCRGREQSLRFGLGMIGSLGEARAQAIVSERRLRGAFLSVDSLARRVNLDRTDAEALAGSGALDSLSPGMSRAEKLMRLLSAQAEREGDRAPAHAQGELFAADQPAPRRRPIPAPPSPASASRDGVRLRLESQMRYLGTTLSEHPLSLWPGALSLCRSLGSELSGLVGRRVRLVGLPITAKPVITAGGQAMEFVSFEDETALYEAVLFPQAYARYRPLLFDQQPLLLHGLVEENRGVVTLTVEGMERIA